MCSKMNVTDSLTFQKDCRDRPELIFINSAETETGPKLVMQFRPKMTYSPEDTAIRNWGQIYLRISAETENQ